MQIFLDKDKQPQYYRVYSMQKETPLFLLHSFSSLSLRFKASPSGPPRAAKPFHMPPGDPPPQDDPGTVGHAGSPACGPQ